MTGSNPFAFTGSRNPQNSSSDASMRAKLARLERENATLQRELRDAKDANGVARAQVDATVRVQDAQREMKRAQMAERIARKALDDLLITQKMAQNPMESQEDVTTLRPEPVGKEAGKPQVESETACQGLLARASENTDDTQTKHGACDCAVVRIRDTYTEFDRKLSEATTEISKLKAANDNLEASSKRTYSQLRELDTNNAEAKLNIRGLEDDLQRSEYRLEECEHKLHAREDEYDELYRAMEERIAAGVAEANDTITKLKRELRGTKAQLDQAAAENLGLHDEAKGYGEELNKLRTENSKFQRDLEHQEQLEEHLNENNERLLADLADEQRQRSALNVERENIEKELADTRQALQDAERSEAEIRREYEVQLDEFSSARFDVTEQLTALQEQVESQNHQTDEHKDHIAARHRRIETLEQENRVLKAELVVTRARQSSPRPVVSLRSVSTTSHNSLADELGTSDGKSIDDFFDDVEPVSDRGELGISDVYHISTAPYEIAKSQPTVSVSDAVATTPHQRQDSPLECSPVNSVSSVEPFHPVSPKLAMYHSAVANFAPSQPEKPALTFYEDAGEFVSPISPTPASLAMSEISSVACGPIQATATWGLQRLSPHIAETLNYHPVRPESPPTPAPQKLTLHVFKQSIIKVDPESASVCVTDLPSDRPMSETLSIYNPLEESVSESPKKPYTLAGLQRRIPIEIFAKSSKLSNAQDLERNTASWPVTDSLTNTQTTSHLSTTIDVPPISAAETPCTTSTEQKKGMAISAHMLMLFLTLLLSPYLASLLPVSILPFGLLVLQQVISKQTRRLDPTINYLLHALMVPLAFLCWRFWSQLHAWEQVNGVGFGEGYGNADGDFGPYGNGHTLLSRLPPNWVSADSHLPAKAVEVITSTVSAFEGLIGFRPTPSF